MIIVLDTTVVLSDPALRARFWDQLKIEAKRHGARVLVPELVVLEAVEHHNRDMLSVITHAGGLGKKQSRFTGVEEARAAAIEVIRARIAEYGSEVRAFLAGLGIEVIDPPPIEHLIVARRAVLLRKPFDSNEKKDGYRDTLNWLTVLDVAETNPGHVVYWVSNNTSDFGSGDEDNRVLHDDLVEDLSERGLKERVSWHVDVPTLLAELAEREAPVPKEKWFEVLSAVSKSDFHELLTNSIDGLELNAGAPGGHFPIIESCRVFAVARFEESEWNGLADTGADGFVVRFEVPANVVTESIERRGDGTRIDMDHRTLQVSGVLAFAKDGAINDLTLSDVVLVENASLGLQAEKDRRIERLAQRLREGPDVSNNDRQRLIDSVAEYLLDHPTSDEVDLIARAVQSLPATDATSGPYKDPALSPAQFKNARRIADEAATLGIPAVRLNPDLVKRAKEGQKVLERIDPAVLREAERLGRERPSSS
ncbi:PIN domain-containing protein [Rhodococcus sp. NPDC055112]